MKAPLNRCQNCGDVKSNHRLGKCQTSLKETRWKPWTEEAWAAAVVAGDLAIAELKNQHQPAERTFGSHEVFTLSSALKIARESMAGAPPIQRIQFQQIARLIVEACK